MVSWCKLLGVRSFVLEVRSWSGNDVPVNLHRANVILCSDKKGQGLTAQFSPSKVQVLAKREGVSAGAGHPSPERSSSTRSGSSSAQAWLKRRVSAGGSLRSRSRRLPLPLGRPPPGSPRTVALLVRRASVQTPGLRECATVFQEQGPGAELLGHQGGVL